MMRERSYKKRFLMPNRKAKILTNKHKINKLINNNMAHVEYMDKDGLP